MSLRSLERDSIQYSVQRAADDGLLSGKVLDYGCGRSPYRWIVEQAGGHYVRYDRRDFPASLDGGFDAIREPTTEDRFTAVLCTQVIQYVMFPSLLLDKLHGLLEPEHGWLVMTGPTNWPVVEMEDLHRFTITGVRWLMTVAGFKEVAVGSRAEVSFESEPWSLGWWARGRA